VRQLLITANVVSSSPILVALMIETLRSSETSVITRATTRIIPEDGILQFLLKRHSALSLKTTFLIVTAMKIILEDSGL
jgi:hypothetical protein